ncbi:sigma-70 family RNA polymerase sigma factor [Candidatus Formimonas warabiya]|uniref:RNA polymerase subunit sigma-24 n=1 Tax=Formimonas warabiya TaxID=1761012 RepID=A0A3G1KZV8_FORW1|nr:sigma-70 family RNA polymerase sigma factor [Candidatus Formimonas warabiya]ATW27931.1 RNA polymerase subunit sigma-24 [Candidatus Formimonas warabiya]
MESAVLVAENAPKEQKCRMDIDAGTFKEIYETHYKRVYNYISYRINNHHDTADLVSQVFERVIQKYRTYEPKCAVFEAWLIGIARNTVTDYLRKQKKNFSISLDYVIDFISGSSQPEEVIVINENNKSLVKALAKLSDKERNIVALKFAAELKNRDIAELMGISDSNVGVILFRSLKKLRKELEKEV